MSLNIYKYDLDFTGVRSFIPLPSNAKILDIQNQNNRLVLWALVNVNDVCIDREFVILGTGHGLPSTYDNEHYPIHYLEHLKTVQIGDLVWHIFEDTLPF